MTKKQIISNHQLFALTGLASLGGSVIIATAPMTAAAGQDAWLGALVSAAYGAPLYVLYHHIGSRYPGMNLIGILRQILGKWLGTLIASLYVVFFGMLSYNIPWYIMDFMGHVMHETPQYAISLPFVVGCSVAVLYGVEVIARASEILIKFVTVIFFASIFMVLPNAKPDNILPVLEKGLVPVLKSSVFLSCYISFPMISLLMVYPLHIGDALGARKPLLKGFLWSNLIAFIVIAVSILVLGGMIASKSKYPTFLLLKEINIGDIFTRLEYFISVVWIVTQFVVCSLFFYSSVTGLAELFRLKDYRYIVPPFALFVFIMTGVVFPSDVYNMNWLSFGWYPFSITMGVVIPLILPLASGVKKLIKRLSE